MDGQTERTGAPPRDFETLKTLLLESRNSLPPRLIQVAAFALEHPDEMALGTAASIAVQAAVQPSTLIRFAKRFGYSGFSDLQGVFRSEMRSNWPDYRERLARLQSARAAGGPHPLLSGFAESAMVSLERLMSQASDDDIGRAAEILARRRGHLSPGHAPRLPGRPLSRLCASANSASARCLPITSPAWRRSN